MIKLPASLLVQKIARHSKVRRSFFQNSKLGVVLLELTSWLRTLETRNCLEGSNSCDDIRRQMEVELHQMQQAIERTEARIKQVDIESKQTLDKNQR